MTALALITVECKVRFTRVRHGRKRMTVGEQPEATPPPPPGRVAKISWLMARAIRLEELVKQGHVKDYADIARLGHVTRARVTQIMALLNFAPDIQEDILFLPPTVKGRDPVKEWEIRPIAACLEWETQRRLWRRLRTCLNTNLSAATDDSKREVTPPQRQGP